MVRDLHLDYLRAILRGDLARVELLERELLREPPRSRKAAGVLISAMFEQSMRRRFGPDASRAEIIRFVARARVDGLLQTVDVRAAERLIIAYLTEEEAVLHELDPNELSRALIDLTVAVLPTPASAEAIDELLHEARTRADQVAEP